MADFCTKCASDMGFSTPDIDILKVAEGLEPDYYQSGFICEGCGLVAIGNIDGKVKIAKLGITDHDGELMWLDYDESI
jgi:hypothetical protein